MYTMATPSSFMRLTCLKRSSTSLALSTAVGSSRIKTRSFCSKALAISTICCWAVPSLRMGRRVSMSTPKELSSSLLCRCMAE